MNAFVTPRVSLRNPRNSQIESVNSLDGSPYPLTTEGVNETSMKKGQASNWKKGKIHDKKVIEAQLRGDNSLNHLTEKPGGKKKK